MDHPTSRSGALALILTCMTSASGHKTKARIDALLVDRGLSESPQRALAALLAGEVRVDGRLVTKPGLLVSHAASLQVTPRPAYVSRGGEKLAHALAAFDIDVGGMTCLDAGASTGGFTDCLLQHGASKVYAVDVGYGALDYGLRKDARRRGHGAHERPRPATPARSLRSRRRRRVFHWPREGATGDRSRSARRRGRRAREAAIPGAPR